ncbi:hypothetical protein HN51_039647 [Arachis hypogaea]
MPPPWGPPGGPPAGGAYTYCAAAVSWRVVVDQCLVDLQDPLTSDEPYKMKCRIACLMGSVCSKAACIMP